MLSFLRALVGCWHRWGKWQNYSAMIVRISGRKTGPQQCQERFCEKCGKRQWRET